MESQILKSEITFGSSLWDSEDCSISPEPRGFQEDVGLCWVLGRTTNPEWVVFLFGWFCHSFARILSKIWIFVRPDDVKDLRGVLRKVFSPFFPPSFPWRHKFCRLQGRWNTWLTMAKHARAIHKDCKCACCFTGDARGGVCSYCFSPNSFTAKWKTLWSLNFIPRL